MTAFHILVSASLAFVAVMPPIAFSAVSPAATCEAGKNLVAGQYAACLQKAAASRATTGDAVKYDQAVVKCGTKLAQKWDKLEAKAAGACPTNGDRPTLQTTIEIHTAAVAGKVAGRAVCGDGFLQEGEDCELGTLSGETCTSLGHVGGGTLRCRPATCAFDESACID